MNCKIPNLLDLHLVAIHSSISMDWWLWWMMNIDYHSIHFNQFYFAGENFLCIYIDGNNWSAFHLSSWYSQHEEAFNLKILETKWTILSPQKEFVALDPGRFHLVHYCLSSVVATNSSSIVVVIIWWVCIGQWGDVSHNIEQ